MDTTEKANALRRLASAGRAHHQARAITLQKGMRLALARVADELLDMPLAMIGAVVQPVLGEDLAEKLSDQALLLQMDGPLRARGAVMLDQALVGGLIQQQTLGLVREHDGTDRTMTRTDAAMCAPLVDALLARVSPMLDDESERKLIEDFRFGIKAEDVRSLCISLDAREYTSIRLTIDVAQGARQGEMVFFFPVQDGSDVGLEDALGLDGAAVQRPQLVDTVMMVEAVLEMVVCNVPMTLDAVHALKPGDVLALPSGHFPNVTMTTRTGRIVGRGTVGQVDGVRAVKPKEKPRHANQPMRRMADEDALDVPHITLPGQDRRRATQEGGPAPVGFDTDLPGMDDLSGLAPVGADIALPDLDGLPSLGETGDASVPDGLDLPDLPDLDGLPDLPDLDAQQGDAAPAPIGPEDADIPALDDLPDLADLPDLSDLPDLPPIKATG